MAKIAVVGGGIAGMAAAYYLSPRHEVWLYEKEDRVGGHTHTVTVPTPAGRLAVDTGFIVFNERNYPRLVELFARLGVRSKPSDMSFSVSSRATGFEYSSRGAKGFFADPRQAVAPSHYRLLASIFRFHRAARRLLADGRAGEAPLAEWLERERFTPAFARRFLYPMASAIWSTSLAEIESFPAGLLARFFHNHGLLQVFGNPGWRVVDGGSARYLAPLTAPFRDRIVTSARLRSVRRDDLGVTLRFEDRPPARVDEVVFACHGDQVLPLLEDATPAERSVLGAFRSSRNETWLHTDAGVLPRRAAARASWNYHLDASERAVSLTYHMNRLQGFEAGEEYCVTLHPEGIVDESKVIRKMSYRHPLYTLDTLRAQARWQEISGVHRAHFCGAYWFNGFHEDGVRSAVRVAEAIAAATDGVEVAA